MRIYGTLNTCSSQTLTVSDETKEFKCSLCSKTYEEKIYLYEHMKYLHYDATKAFNAVQKNCIQRKKIRFGINRSHQKDQESQLHGVFAKMGISAISEGNAAKNHKCIKCNN